MLHKFIIKGLNEMIFIKNYIYIGWIFLFYQTDYSASQMS